MTPQNIVSMEKMISGRGIGGRCYRASLAFGFLASTAASHIVNSFPLITALHAAT